MKKYVNILGKRVSAMLLKQIAELSFHRGLSAIAKMARLNLERKENYFSKSLSRNRCLHFKSLRDCYIVMK